MTQTAPQEHSHIKRKHEIYNTCFGSLNNLNFFLGSVTSTEAENAQNFEHTQSISRAWEEVNASSFML